MARRRRTAGPAAAPAAGDPGPAGVRAPRLGLPLSHDRARRFREVSSDPSVPIPQEETMLSRIIVPAALAVLAGLTLPAAAAPRPAAPKPKVEVVFCLDTTGSMGGLIE